MVNAYTELPPELGRTTIVTTGSDLIGILSTFITPIIHNSIRSIKQEELQEKLLSPEETCKLFTPAISIPTLNSYYKKGYLEKYYLEGRTWYKYSEVMAALKSIKRYERK